MFAYWGWILTMAAILLAMAFLIDQLNKHLDSHREDDDAEQL